MHHNRPVDVVLYLFRCSKRGGLECVLFLKFPLFLGHLPESWQNLCRHSRYFLTYHPSFPNIFLVRQEGSLKQTP